MIRIEKAKACSYVTTVGGDKLPVHAWLITIGRRSFIITTYKRPPMGDIGENA